MLSAGSVALWRAFSRGLRSNGASTPDIGRRTLESSGIRGGASFVGRAAELDELCDLLDARSLVTIVGEGGVGKTRLAAAGAA